MVGRSSIAARGFHPRDGDRPATWLRLVLVGAVAFVAWWTLLELLELAAR